ncbi:MAG TPA: ABC transporter ATP-binding protein [Firmicutes bacterium]|nr:ABC transporter ATP-binding protein [Bacillota bacterium]
MSVLEIKNLVAGYGPIIALHGVSLHVEQGELVSLVGANGAGKSTLLSSIIGLVKVNEGEIIYENENLVGKKYYDIIRKGISIVPEGRQVFPGMTVEENLRLGSFCLKADQKRDSDTLEQVFEYFPRLKERIRQSAGTLSGGEQQMLAVGRALMAHPKLLILDEPSMGLAPLVVNQVFEIIRKIKETGVTMMLIEQNANKALKISDRAYVLRTGNVIMEDKAENLLGNAALLESYLK